MSQCTSTFEVDLPILVAFYTQSISSSIKVRETLYFANPFRIKFKVTLNIGVTEVRCQNSVGTASNPKWTMVAYLTTPSGIAKLPPMTKISNLLQCTLSMQR